MIADRWLTSVSIEACQRCGQQKRDDEQHMLLECAWFNDIRLKYPELFQEGDGLKEIMNTENVYVLARFIMEAEKKIHTEIKNNT